MRDLAAPADRKEVAPNRLPEEVAEEKNECPLADPTGLFKGNCKS